MDDLATISADIPWPDHEAEGDARERSESRTTSLGQLDELAQWLCGVQGAYPPADLRRVRVVIFAGDHGIAEAGVSASSRDATARWAVETAAGDRLVNALADLAGAGVRVVDIAVDDDATPPHRVRRSSGRIDREDAMTPDEVLRAVQAGVDVADDEIDSGADLLIAGQLGVGATTPASVLVSVMTNTEPVKVIGRGSGIDDNAWMRKATAIRDARARAWPHRSAPMDLLAAAAGPDIAAVTGFLIRAAARRTPVLLDGLVVTAAALSHRRFSRDACGGGGPGSSTSEPAHAVAMRRLGLSRSSTWACRPATAPALCWRCQCCGRPPGRCRRRNRRPRHSRFP